MVYFNLKGELVEVFWEHSWIYWVQIQFGRIFKILPWGTNQIMSDFLNIILNSGIVPSEWTSGIIKPICEKKKSGDINNVNNYRGISLLRYIGMLFTSTLNSGLYHSLTFEDILGSKRFDSWGGRDSERHISMAFLGGVHRKRNVRQQRESTA